MSQMTQNTGPVKPKVRSPHPAAAAAAKFRDETMTLRGEGTASANPEPTNTQAASVAPTPTPASATESATTPGVTYTPAATMQPPVGYVDMLAVNPTTPPTSTPTTGVSEEELEARFKQRYADTLAELEQVRKERDEARALSEEARRITDEQKLAKLLQESGANLGSIDQADAIKLLTPVMATMREQAKQSSKQTEERLQQVEQLISEQAVAQQERENKARLERTRAAILKAHPDLEELQKTAAYQQVMQSPVGSNSGLLIGNLVAAELQRGNADYIIHVLDQVKGQTTQTANPATSISPSATAAAPAATGTNDGLLTEEQLMQYKNAVQTGQMSRSEFRDIMQKHREAKR